MTVIPIQPATPHRLSAPLDFLWRRHAAMTGIGLLLVLAVLPLGLASLIDERTLNGVSVWSKPLKFAVALSLYTLTLAYFAGWVEAGARQARVLRWAMTAAVAAIAFEQLWIVFQASRAQASHFNFETPFAALMYAAMGIGAVILTFAAPALGWQIWRRPVEGLAPALQAGAALALLLTFPLTIVTAGYMGGEGSHFVGGSGSDAAGLVIMGWARDGGDLRVPHFFATHAMHVLPLMAIACAFIFGRERRLPVVVVSLAYVVFVGLVFLQALAGRPFLPILG